MPDTNPNPGTRDAQEWATHYYLIDNFGTHDYRTQDQFFGVTWYQYPNSPNTRWRDGDNDGNPETGQFNDGFGHWFEFDGQQWRDYSGNPRDVNVFEDSGVHRAATPPDNPIDENPPVLSDNGWMF